ncbi:MAG: hypothetical protein WBA84_10085 [Carnobacterium sp.]|uniref:hypothetical protein n=1 Tax=Carnobacterium sp. TaxID=48221 RepID=UPI003C71D5C7
MSKNSNYKVTGFKDMSKKLNTLSKNADKMSGEQSVDFDTLFPLSFMETHTDKNEIYSFFTDGGFDVSSTESFEKIDDDELDVYVKENTDFSTWHDMKVTAAEEYTLKMLGL